MKQKNLDSSVYELLTTLDSPFPPTITIATLTMQSSPEHASASVALNTSEARRGIEAQGQMQSGERSAPPVL